MTGVDEAAGPEGAPDPDRGVDFARPDGRASTTSYGREVVTAALRAADPLLADHADARTDWRKDYLAPFRDLAVASLSSRSSTLALSRAGLDAAYAGMQFVRDGVAVPLSASLGPDATAARPGLEGVTVEGTGSGRRSLRIPYDGAENVGDEVLPVLDDWEHRGLSEPSVRAAMTYLLDHPEWLDLSDATVVVLGAGAQMGPVRSLLDWGATVHAIDLPRPDLWRRLMADARGRAGRLVVPVPAGFSARRGEVGDDAIAAVAGVDVLRSLPEVTAYVQGLPGPLVVATYVYADGGTHVRLSMAVDALMTAITAARRDVMLAWLATPTDAYAVPWECVEESRRRWSARGVSRATTAPLRLARQFRPNYAHTVRSRSGVEYGVADCLVPQQGPNYALAKRIQRWRALIAREEGVRVSLNVAPATRTTSVVKNRALAAAYAGAHRFGVEIFEPDTSNSVMAAMLVHDMRNPASSSNPEVALDTPLRLFMDGAHHGGLWRTAYDPRSVLTTAALLGLFNRGA